MEREEEFNLWLAIRERMAEKKDSKLAGPRATESSIIGNIYYIYQSFLLNNFQGEIIDDTIFQRLSAKHQEAIIDSRCGAFEIEFSYLANSIPEDAITSLFSNVAVKM